MSTNIQLGDKISFIKLFSQTALSVRIPIIQRDYAQGRASAYEVRKAFLTALLTYLRAEGTHDLDFVYGAVSEGQDFLPLDGQQRLTTLFLLHWYLAQSAIAQRLVLLITTVCLRIRRYVLATRPAPVQGSSAKLYSPTPNRAAYAPSRESRSQHSSRNRLGISSLGIETPLSRQC